MYSIGKRNLIFTLIAMMLFSGCQKENLENPAPEQEEVNEPCKLMQEIIYEYNSNKVSSYSEYLYNSNGLIYRINTFHGDSLLAYFSAFSYNGQGKAMEEVYHAADGSIAGKLQFGYNAAGLLHFIKFHGLMNGAYLPEQSQIVLHYNNAGQRIRADFYSATQPNQVERYFEYTYGQGVINAKEFKATTNPATFFQNVEFKYDNKQSRYHALGYLNGYIPDLEKHNLTLRKEWLPGYTKYWGIGFEYDSLGYPIKGHPYQSITFWEDPTIEYVYDCN